MKKFSRKIVRATARHSVRLTKKQLSKHPALKSRIANVLTVQLGSRNLATAGYADFVNRNFPDAIDVVRLKAEAANFAYRPLISVIVPTYNTNIEHLKDCLDSVLSQVYDNWQLCIVDDASDDKQVPTVIKEYAKGDKRIKYKFLPNNKHIAGASNAAIALADGEFISLFDHDDLLWPNALYEIVLALNHDPSIDFLYTDEDKITDDRHEHLGAFFKPDWNPDFLHSVNYITHFTTVRKSLIDKLGGFREKYNGAQDWDLFLRAASETTKIYHIPKIVYSWRVHSKSTAMSTNAKPYVVSAQKTTIEDDLARRGYQNVQVEQDNKHKGYWKLTYPVNSNPLISIVIPSKNQFSVVKRCIDSIYTKTTYKNFEIILVDTGSTDKKVLKWYQALAKQHRNFKLVEWSEQPFSYSRSCNKGAEIANGELLVMLNNDTEVLTPNWLELMAGDAQRKEVGAVGALLFFPDGKHIQHAGIGVGLGGLAANSFSMMTLEQPLTQTQHLMLNTRHNLTAVTAACLMMRKELFLRIGGFSEEFRVTYNDVDLCLRIHELGYNNLYTPYVRLIHHESISVGAPDELKKRDTTEFKAAKKLFLDRWAKYIKHDPNLNPNLSKDNAYYDV